MKEQKNKLDEAIKALQNDTITTGPPKEVLDATLARLKGALPEKAGEVAAKAEGIKSSKKLIQFGSAAAIMIVAGLILIGILAGPEGQEVMEVAREQEAPQMEGVAETTELDLDVAADRLAARLGEELESIEEFFAAGDVVSLVAMLDEGMYFEALVVLEDDILVRPDGCATIGEPDEDDWITSFEGQEAVYPLLSETIKLLESFME